MMSLRRRAVGGAEAAAAIASFALTDNLSAPYNHPDERPLLECPLLEEREFDDVSLSSRRSSVGAESVDTVAPDTDEISKELSEMYLDEYEQNIPETLQEVYNITDENWTSLSSEGKCTILILRRLGKKT